MKDKEFMQNLIHQWAKARGLDGGHPYAQGLKVMEEAGELASALLKKQSLATIQDAIGDVNIALEVLAMQLGTNVRECTELAYKDIKDRQGRMVDGNFIKDADLGGGYYYDTDGQGD